jgi:hypothetical protein
MLWTDLLCHVSFLFKTLGLESAGFTRHYGVGIASLKCGLITQFHRISLWFTTFSICIQKLLFSYHNYRGNNMDEYSKQWYGLGVGLGTGSRGKDQKIRRPGGRAKVNNRQRRMHLTRLAIVCADEARLKTNGITGSFITKLSQGL